MEEDEAIESTQASFISHFLELRKRVFFCITAILIVFLSLYYFSNRLYTWLAKPLLNQLPHGHTLIATDVAAPFLAPLKLTFALSFFIAIPFILHQLWGFISPGLYQRERRFAAPLLISSILLFYAGMAFTYFVVFPLLFGFLTRVAPEGVAVTPDISTYLNFTLKLFFAFGVAFEVPIATLLLIWSDIISADSLSKKRPYVIVLAFVLGMLLTPPDLISQILLAIPLWLLFEAGLFVSRFLPNVAADR